MRLKTWFRRKKSFAQCRRKLLPNAKNAPVSPNPKRRKIEQINLASGQREAEIQQSEGEAQAAVNASNAEKIARINRAKGEAESLRLVAEANAEAIRQIAAAASNPRRRGCGQSEDCGTIRRCVQQSCQRKQYADYARQCCRHRQPDFCRYENYRQQQNRQISRDENAV